MGEVLDIVSYLPIWETVRCECLTCFRRWVAVTLVSDKWCECPGCGDPVIKVASNVRDPNCV